MKWFRWWWLLLLIPIIAGLARLHFDVEMLDLLPAQVPAVQGLKIYQEHFTDARELIITVRAPDRETAELAARPSPKICSTRPISLPLSLAARRGWSIPNKPPS